MLGNVRREQITAAKQTFFWFDFDPFTPATFKRNNPPPIPWEFWPKNLCARRREVNHMPSKAKDKIKFSNKLPFEVE